MKKYLWYSVLFFFLSLQSSAQQLSKVSFYRHNWSKLNPAAIPREAVEFRSISTLANLNYRIQKHVVSSQAPTILDGSIETVWPDQYRKKGMSTYTDNKLGLFVNAENDGIIKTSSASLNYARMYSIGTDGRMSGKKNSYDLGFLAIGLTLTYRNRRIDLNSVTWNNVNRFSTDIIQHNYLNINAGVFWYWNLPSRSAVATGKEGGRNKQAGKRKFSAEIQKINNGKKPLGYVGLSVLQPTQTQIGRTEYGNDVAHINGIAGMMYHSFEVSNWVRYVPKLSFITLGETPSPFSFDVNLRYFYNHSENPNVPRAGDGFWIGAGWSSAKTANVEVGYRCWVNQGSSSLANYVQIGLAYTDLLNTANTITKPTSFELNFSWNFADNRAKKGK
jgi:Type IX secretion system membrane protein PorP/SprF